jgi:hypothetical protein
MVDGEGCWCPMYGTQSLVAKSWSGGSQAIGLMKCRASHQRKTEQVVLAAPRLGIKNRGRAVYAKQNASQGETRGRGPQNTPRMHRGRATRVACCRDCPTSEVRRVHFARLLRMRPYAEEREQRETTWYHDSCFYKRAHGRPSSTGTTGNMWYRSAPRCPRVSH